MTAVHFDSPFSDEERRERLYRGEIFIYSPGKSSRALVEHSRQMIELAFAPRDPQVAQFDMEVADFAGLLGKLKPAFTHHPTSKALIRGMLQEIGADLNDTYFDVPKMRSSTSHQYLTTGIALAFPPHRDTWYAAPFQQINCWMPIYDITSENGMAFYPHYFNNPIKNNSEVYNYYQWNKTRATAHLDLGKGETKRVAPEAQESVDGQPDPRYIMPPGGMIMFSGAQLHRSLPNTSGRTRYSLDFRTVHIEDVRNNRGAKNIDSACTGTALRDFKRGTDEAALPEELVRPYDSGDVGDGMLVYEPGTPPL